MIYSEPLKNISFFQILTKIFFIGVNRITYFYKRFIKNYPKIKILSNFEARILQQKFFYR